jgi:hypothetical protein
MLPSQSSDESAQAAQIFQGPAREWIWERTVGLYFKAPGGNPVLQGTGVLLQVADICFVLTASHVLKKSKDMEIQIGPMAKGSRMIRVLECQIVYSNDENDMDVGVMRISADAALLLKEHKSFLRMDSLDLRTSTLCAGRYCILGFPQQINITDYERKEIDAKHFHYMSRVLDLPDEGRPQITIWFKISHHTVTSLDSETSTEEDVRMPELGGISGCGMWRLYGVEDKIHRLDQWEPSWIRLVGIEHAWVRGKRIKATFVKHVVDLIAYSCPELRSSIEVSMALIRP